MNISEKLSEIERNIKEGETVLAALRNLPESEETNDQIKRFQELVRQLEEYRERYKALQASSLNDFEVQLESLRDKHDRIKILLEQSAPVDSKPSSSTSNLLPSCNLQESISPVHQTSDLMPDKKMDFDQFEHTWNLDNISNEIEPSEWHSHYESQTRYLSSMLAQVARFQEMVGRLSNLVIGLGMDEAVKLLSDVGQRFTDVHLRLLSLQTTYETIYNHEDPSDDFRANHLKDLRGFLISLGRSLEVTKECFFTVANIVKKTFQSPGSNGSPNDYTPGELDKPDPLNPIKEIGEHRIAQTGTPTGDALTVETVSDHSKKQKHMELTIAELYKQRDALLDQLAEARARASGSISLPKGKSGNVSELKITEPLSEFGHTDDNHTPSLTDAGQSSDSLPILKRLQARKEYLEELKGELRSFSFPTGDEVPPTTNSSVVSPVSTQSEFLSSNALKNSSVTKVITSRPSTSPRVTVTNASTGAVTSNHEDVSAPVQVPFSISESPIPRRSTQGIVSVGSSDIDAVTQKCEVVTFQEPEATYLDNTERLYKTMREARIWREEHRQAPVASTGDKEGEKSNRLRNGGLSESTSCMDATAMATWGGDSDREGNDIGDDMVVSGEYIEDVPSIVSSRSSRANRRFTGTSTCSVNDGDGSSLRDCLGVRTDPQDTGVGLSLPQLGHSPSPHTAGSRTATTRILQARQSRPTRQNHGDLAAISFEEYAFTKPLAAKIAHLEFKVEQLTQTCQLLVTENARLNSALSVLLASHRLPSVAGGLNVDWPTSHSGAVFTNPKPSMISIPASGPFSSPVSSFRPPESVSGLSLQSLAPAPPTPTLHPQSSPSLEKALDQVQMLTAQVIEQHSRMNQLQNNLHLALQQQQQQQLSGGGDAGSGPIQLLSSISGMRSYQSPPQLSSGQGSRRGPCQTHATSFSTLLPLQTTTGLPSR